MLILRSLLLLLLRAHALDALDLQRRTTGLFGDLAVLLGDGGLGRLIAVESPSNSEGTRRLERCEPSS